MPDQPLIARPLQSTPAGREEGPDRDLMSAQFIVRRATVADAAVIARHRAEMFKDMGSLSDDLYQPLVAATIAYLEVAIPREEYIGWLAASVDEPGVILAGAGVQQRQVLPHPPKNGSENKLAVGRQGIVLNVFTERAWRRRGLAALVMNQVLDWTRNSGIETLVLHAAPDGRHLYEKLGFVQTNEMRLGG